jgi:hypothetical protein
LQKVPVPFFGHFRRITSSSEATRFNVVIKDFAAQLLSGRPLALKMAINSLVQEYKKVSPPEPRLAKKLRSHSSLGESQFLMLIHTRKIIEKRTNGMRWLFRNSLIDLVPDKTANEAPGGGDIV